ncbi:hypothetical protein A3Q56_01906 [Intoshia linei]|uniref:Uncharacterized protein n=1 Tax=Intoshia linei TaxID=1819745 RepID=A0A177B7R7_9BILA|nr:hypothetical protein A3Q56_01906 [Intoshia linei]
MGKNQNLKIIAKENLRIEGIIGYIVDSNEITILELFYNNEIFYEKFFILPDFEIYSKSKFDLILGMNFLRIHDCTLQIKENILNFNKEKSIINISTDFIHNDLAVIHNKNDDFIMILRY